jgi:hypothetical protein
MDRRQRWFAEGAAALRRTVTLPRDGDFYACPCCLLAYDRGALDTRFLTDEHVPPEAVGGKILVLTCAPCNHQAGSQLDAHADRRQAVQDLISGRSDARKLRTEIAVDGIVLRGNITGVGDALLLSVVGEANNPKDLVETERILDGWSATEGVEGRFGFRVVESVSVPNARLSWVRAAYLAAFAALGYRYAFLAQLAQLRAQLVNPEMPLLPSLTMIDDRAPPGGRQLLLVREPAELRSLAVTMGRHMVFLPAPDEPQPFAATAAALGAHAEAPRPRLRLLGKEVPWPVEPQYALDR